MKRIYETFQEIADDFTNGEFKAHQLSDHSEGVCYVWQTAIEEFAIALDNAGIKLPNDEEVWNKFWDNIHDSFTDWKAGFNKKKPSKKCLGTMSREEAKQKYNFIGGNRLIIYRYDIDGDISEDYYKIID